MEAKGAKTAFQILAKCCVFIATQMKKPNFETLSGLLSTYVKSREFYSVT